jgi:hypothetical protein
MQHDFWSELVVLHKIPSMSSKLLVMWRFVRRTFYIGSWRVKLIFAWQERLDKMSLALNEPK